MKTMAIDKLKKYLLQNENSFNSGYEFLSLNRTNLAKKFMAYFSPDSKFYSSPLQPVFSFELNSTKKDTLKTFELIFLRDGVLLLLKFFKNHPFPDKYDPILVVNKNLEALVPIAWRGQVLLSKLVCVDKIIEKKVDKLIIFVSPEKQSTPFEVIEKELIILKDKINKNTEIYIYFSSVSARGEEDAFFDNSWKYKLMLKLTSHLINFKISVISYGEYLKLSISGFSFLELNPLLYNFSDSYLVHDAMSRGAIPIYNSPIKTKDKFIMKVSESHGFELHSSFEKDYFIDNFIEAKYLNCSNEGDSKEDFASIQLADDGFKDWAQFIAIELYNRQKDILD